MLMKLIEKYNTYEPGLCQLALVFFLVNGLTKRQTMSKVDSFICLGVVKSIAYSKHI